VIKVFVIGAVVVVVAFVALVASHGGGASGGGGSGSSEEAQLIGLTRDQVVAKLGPPDQESGKELDYDQPLAGSTDKHVLRVYLDGDGRVKATTTDVPETGAP
jgi:hypothetical protein